MKRVMIDVSLIREMIIKKYGDDDSGCYYNSEWLSPKKILDLIDEAADDYGEEDDD